MRPVPGRRMRARACGESLLALGSRAGVIFAGHVVRVTREDDAGFVEVRFAGGGARCGGAAARETYVLREWAGLWMGRRIDTGWGRGG